MKAYKVLSVVLLASLVTFAMSNGAPSLTCTQCHVDAKGLPPNKIIIKGLPEKGGKYYYVPGKAYKLTIEIEHQCTPAMSNCAGFAFTVSSGELKVIDPENTFLTQAFDFTTGQTIAFVTHTKEGAQVNKWVVEWIAPNDAKPVQLKVAALAANGDGAPTGDAYGVKIVNAVPMQAEQPTTTQPAPAAGNVVTVTKTVVVTTTVTLPVTTTIVVCNK
ncbi:choice-of-anchor V domain-containing protein [Ignicoccus islandicus]|uniref:choice-of-anchor V domain-containing protein n=1 Tax=Ignicoccus islandicus TaxID=54259 RepID=UPI000946734F|nr:choice-of-anchor V domain-containing protein [Ignicoccus islandicus]